MFGVGHLSRTGRLVLGIVVLLVVDVIWVASSELTKYLFQDEHFDKPYFSTYLKLSMFTLYLSGFMLRRTAWWTQCSKQSMIGICDEEVLESENLLSEPIYVPIKHEEKSINNGGESDDSLGDSRSVRFSNLSEVRQLPDGQAEEAVMARLSFPAYQRAEEVRMRASAKLSVKQVAKLAFVFTVIFFLGNLSYQEALRDTEAGIVNVLSSTSALFTLVLSGIFPGSSADRFSVSKFFAVGISISGIVLVSLSDMHTSDTIPLGALWSLAGALFYALYLVLLRRRADNEDKLNLPMFLGFVGVATAFLMWPGFFIAHFTHDEPFQWPNRTQLLILLLNGLVGTVLSELLWLWGCFLTSSLIATLSLGLTTPMTMMADTLIKGESYGWMFYVGSLPILLSFLAVACLTHWDTWDPVLMAFKKCLCRRRGLSAPSRNRTR